MLAVTRVHNSKDVCMRVYVCVCVCVLRTSLSRGEIVNHTEEEEKGVREV